MRRLELRESETVNSTTMSLVLVENGKAIGLWNSFCASSLNRWNNCDGLENWQGNAPYITNPSAYGNLIATKCGDPIHEYNVEDEPHELDICSEYDEETGLDYMRWNLHRPAPEGGIVESGWIRDLAGDYDFERDATDDAERVKEEVCHMLDIPASCVLVTLEGTSW